MLKINNIKLITPKFNAGFKKTAKFHATDFTCSDFSYDSPNAILNKQNITFCGMKKNQLQGIDLVMSNKLAKKYDYNIQLKDINNNDDFQEYCQNILDKKYLGKDNIEKFSKSPDDEIERKRGEFLEEWCHYLKEERSYSPAIQLMILSSITKNMEEESDYLPPILDKKQIDDILFEIDGRAKENNDYEPNFEKMYRENLTIKTLLKEKNLDLSLTGWVIIQGRAHDEKNFKENVRKLQALSDNNCCARAFNAESYLNNGDYHIYFKEGRAKLGLKFKDNTIQTFQGERNNSEILLSYFDVIRQHIKNGKYETSYEADKQLNCMREAKDEIYEIKAEIRETTNGEKSDKYEKILSHLGFHPQRDKDGLLIIDEYCQPQCFSFEDMGVDENEMFKYIKKIDGCADFEGSNLTNLGNLEEIVGHARFTNSKVQSLDKLESIGGDADFTNSSVESLGNLRIINNSAYFTNSKIKSLDKLISIGWNAHFEDSSVESLGDLEEIKGNAYFQDSSVKSLGNLNVMRHCTAPLTQWQIEETNNKLQDITSKKDYTIDDVKRIFDTVCIEYEEDPDGLLYVDNYDRRLNGLNINEDEMFKYIKELGDDIDFKYSNVTDLGNLKTIWGSAYFRESKVKSADNLEYIRDEAVFSMSPLNSIKKLEYIGDDAYFCDSEIKDWSNIEIKGTIY